MLYRLPDQLRTARLRLRAPRRADADAFFREYTFDPRVTRYLEWRPHSTIADTEHFIERCLQDWQGTDRRPYALVRLPEERPVGVLEVRWKGDVVELGYVLGQAHWGQGLMPEALRAVITKALEDQGVDRVEAFVDVDNAASARALEKSGLHRVALIEACGVHPNMAPNARACHHYVLRRGLVSDQ